MPQPPEGFRNSAFEGQVENGNGSNEKPVVAELGSQSSPTISSAGGGYGNGGHKGRTPSELSGIGSPRNYLQGPPSELSAGGSDGKEYKPKLPPVELE